MYQSAPTMAHVYRQLHEVDLVMAHFGVKVSFLIGFDGMRSALIEAIAKEQVVSVEQTMQLPAETELGEKAREKFIELMSFLQQHKDKQQNK